MPDSPRALKAAIRTLQHFAALDARMQVSTALSLLVVADRELSAKPTCTKDIEEIVGLKSGTSTRNTYYWGDGHQEVTGGHGYITVRDDPEDRRRRSLKLTRKGQAFLSRTVLAEDEER